LQRPVDVVMVYVVVANRCDACVVATSSARRCRRVLAARARLDDGVTGRRVRHHVGETADRDECCRGQPPVDPSQTGERGIARDVSSVAPHQWSWWK
jgi:hypothetical protein